MDEVYVGWELLPSGTKARLRELEAQRRCVSVSERLCKVVPAARELVSALRHGMGDWCPACYADVSEGEDDHMENCPLLTAEELLREGG